VLCINLSVKFYLSRRVNARNSYTVVVNKSVVNVYSVSARSVSRLYSQTGRY